MPRTWEWGTDSYSPDDPKGRSAYDAGVPLWDNSTDKPVLVIWVSGGGGMMPSDEDKKLIAAAPKLQHVLKRCLRYGNLVDELVEEAKAVLVEIEN